MGPSVLGDGVDILITDLSYTELSACPANFFIPPKGGPWNCIEVSATANNQGKRVPTAAAVYGLILDAEGSPCLATGLDSTQKTEVAAIGSVPKGKSSVKFVVAVQGRAPKPYRFQGFKAGYRSARLEKTFATFDPCEVDSSKCEDEDDQPANAVAGYSKTGLFGAQY